MVTLNVLRIILRGYTCDYNTNFLTRNTHLLPDDTLRALTSLLHVDDVTFDGKGCLVASTNRGCKAISQGGGCRAALLKDGITRAPCLRMPDAMAAADLKRWSEMPENFERIKAAFQTTTRFGEE